MQSVPGTYILHAQTKDDVQDIEKFRAQCVAAFVRQFGREPERVEPWVGVGFYVGPLKDGEAAVRQGVAG